MNEYISLATYYDPLTLTGYYNYKRAATLLHNVLAGRKKILEVGLGTGSIIETLLEIDPSYQFTGIDFSPIMVEQAKKKLGQKAQIYQADVLSMDLGETFEAIYSHGGVWTFRDDDGEHLMFSHIMDVKQNLQGLKQVAKHLPKGGLFALSFGPMHKNKEMMLLDDIFHKQVVEYTQDDEGYYLKKDYFFEKDGILLGTQTIYFRYFSNATAQTMMADAGFEFSHIESGNKFHIYIKV